MLYAEYNLLIFAAIGLLTCTVVDVTSAGQSQGAQAGVAVAPSCCGETGIWGGGDGVVRQTAGKDAPYVSRDAGELELRRLDKIVVVVLGHHRDVSEGVPEPAGCLAHDGEPEQLNRGELQAQPEPLGDQPSCCG